MTTRFAYLIIERQRYPIETPSQAEAAGSGDQPVDGGAFPDRLRDALDAAAKSAGYGSLERLMGSVRVRGRSAPARAAHVQGLVDAGLLNMDAEISQMTGGAVPDAAWEVLGAVYASRGRSQPIPEPTRRKASQSRTRSVDSWSISLCDGEGIRPIDVDPAQTPARELPIALIAQTLASLAVEGWEVVHISEDRSIDDAASASRVDRQRILLRD